MSEQDGSVIQGEDRRRERKNAHDNLVHAGEFTKTENTAINEVLRGWIPEANRTDDEVLKAANDAWAQTVLLEHFLSELNSDPSTRTRESRAVVAELEKIAAASQARLKELIGEDDEETDDERMNALTDKTVADVLKKLGL
jgi:hypothetical protein